MKNLISATANLPLKYPKKSAVTKVEPQKGLKKGVTANLPLDYPKKSAVTKVEPQKGLKMGVTANIYC